MPALTLDLFGSLAIDQGFEWRMNLLLPGKQLTGTTKGQIQAAAKGLVLADFRSDARIYLEEVDKTQLSIYLSVPQTLAIPKTGSSYWVYFVRQNVLGRSPELLVRGKVRVNEAME